MCLVKRGWHISNNAISASVLKLFTTIKSSEYKRAHAPSLLRFAEISQATYTILLDFPSFIISVSHAFIIHMLA